MRTAVTKLIWLAFGALLPLSAWAGSCEVAMGVLGAGKMGSYHAKKLAQMGGVKLVGVYDPDFTRASALGAELNIEAFHTPDALLSRTAGVVIASPTHTHFELARQALNHGNHVLLEKPMTSSAFELRALSDAAQERGLVLQPGLIERFHLADLHGDGDVSLRGLQADFVSTVRKVPGAPRDPHTDVMADLMVHDLDIVLAVLREEPSSLRTAAVRISSPTADRAEVNIGFPSGKSATLVASRGSTHPERKVVLKNGARTTTYDLIHNSVVETGGRVEIWRDIRVPDSLGRELQAFAESIRNGKPAVVSAEDGVRALRALQRAQDPGRLPKDAAALARFSGGKVIGNPAAPISHIYPLDEAGPEAVAFWASRRHTPPEQIQGAVVLTSPEFVDLNRPITYVVVTDPKAEFGRLLHRYWDRKPEVANLDSGFDISPSAQIAEGVRIEPQVVIGDGATIGKGVVLRAGAVIGKGVSIGAGSEIRAGAIINEGVRIGNRSEIGEKTVIGGAGFGVFPSEQHGNLKMPALGGVDIGSGVRIGAGVTIDRPFAIGNDTKIDDGVFIDNQVTIGHGCKIGANSILCGQVGLAGNVRLGRGVRLMGAAKIAQNLSVGDGAMVAAGSIVLKNVPAGGSVMGYPARPLAETQRALAQLHRTERDFNTLQRQVDELREALERLNSKPKPIEP